MLDGYQDNRSDMTVNDLSLTSRIEATEQNLWGLWERFGRAPGGTLHKEGGAVWFDTVLSQLPYNGVLKFRNDENAEALIDRICAHYEKRGVPFIWIVHPSGKPSNLSHLLEQRGLSLAEVIPGMTMDLNDLPPREAFSPNIIVQEATTKKDFLAAQELIAWRWDVPDKDRQQHLDLALSFNVGEPGTGLRCWVGHLNGKPVSKVLLHLHEGVAGIHGVATKPEARGQGLARALTLEALNAARDSGFRLAMLHSSGMARSLYEKIGFRQVSEFLVYVYGGDLHV